ncbi:hypothetical protein SAMN05421736_11848 [Evansella caseinilytica]|uniref:Uncharacterized protein n=1 Tax=Evansella caseinilytica TaxID=1503961 RepID=A0A1H3U430_9BACI|nr:hypothetical protein [Evansella caseinilytica]SDZ57213.1 hypothetical protein SAMN05421736_11848 [Evansella caseinilytica]
MNFKSSEQTLTKAQLKEVKDKIHACCCHIQYNGHPKPHFNTVSTFIKRTLNIRKLEDIPQDRLHEVTEIIHYYRWRYRRVV